MGCGLRSLVCWSRSRRWRKAVLVGTAVDTHLANLLCILVTWGVLGVYLFGDLPLRARATSPLSDKEMGIAEERMAKGTRAMSFILKLMANSFFYT
jgi:hypothetical protein